MSDCDNVLLINDAFGKMFIDDFFSKTTLNYYSFYQLLDKRLKTI